jgi:hypothetical protein
MRWKRNTGFDQIEDRRGQGSGGVGGGLGGMLGGGSGSGLPLPGKAASGGIGGLVVLVILFLLISGVLGSGGLGDLSGFGAGGAAPPGGTLQPQSDTDQFVAYLVSDIQGFWGDTFAAANRDYPETKLVLFERSTGSPCGQASAATGPFYCPLDQKVYLDLGFFDELVSRFGAEGGDFAIAYVIAHEFGHHVQDALGILQEAQNLSRQDPSRANDLSVRQELQADCFAGVWAHSAVDDLEPGDIEEALSAAEAVGDDRIQQATSGRIDPESWTHGSADQRATWFQRGYTDGNVATCDTFSG